MGILVAILMACFLSIGGTALLFWTLTNLIVWLEPQRPGGKWRFRQSFSLRKDGPFLFGSILMFYSIYELLRIFPKGAIDYL